MPTGAPAVTSVAAFATTNVVPSAHPQAYYVSNSVINPVNTLSSMSQSNNHRSFSGLTPNESNPI